MKRQTLRRGSLALLSTVALCCGACAVDPASVPVPGTGVSGETYSLHIEFANVLNLPPGAKVLADGVEVGNLTGLRIFDAPAANPGARGHVVADIAVVGSTRLAGDATAELRQATPLGDVHIALVTPPGSKATPLVGGATIPLSRTKQAPQVEDTMAGLATALGSGAITDIQDTVRQLNSALPSDPREVGRVAGVVGADLGAIASDLDTLDRLLAGLTQVTVTADEAMPIVDEMLTDAGSRHLVSSVQSVLQILYIFTDLGPLAHAVEWVAPLVGSADAAARAYVPMLFGSRPLDLGAPNNSKSLIDLIENKLIPFTERGPKVNLTTVTVSGPGALPAADSTTRIVDTLRMVGAVR